MNSSNPFDHDSLMYKLMKYLYKIQEQMEMVPWVWILIDFVQFLTIATSLMGYVIKVHYNMLEQDLFHNFLNIFFNYQKIYDWLVISGASSALIVILALLIYIVIEFRKEFKNSTKKKLLSYCAFTGTVSIGLFEFFSQVMANNLINIVSKIFKKELEMSVVLIGCFLLNMVMMMFVSIFNSDRRIFRFSLVLVSLGLNMLAFTLTCTMVIALSLYYQYLDKLVYKKLFYALLIAISLWCSLQINDNHSYQMTSRQVYLAMSVVAIIVYYIHFDYEFLKATFIQENQYLVQLYNKKTHKQDKKEDYMLADQYFTKYFSREREKMNIFAKNAESQFFLTTSVQYWSELDLKLRIIQKIKTQRLQVGHIKSIQTEVSYFQLLLELKINMVQLLEQVFSLMSEKKNQSIKVIYQINKLTNKIEMEFSKMPEMDNSILKIQQIIELEELYKLFYQNYLGIVNLLEEIFESLDTKNGQITEVIEEKLTEFTMQQRVLQKTLKDITSITGPKLQSKLYAILSQIWGKYQKSNQFSQQLQNAQQYNKNPHEQSKQKFNFSYIVISNKTIKYASIKFLSTYSYKESFITGEGMGLIFPHKFMLFVEELIEKNAGNKLFVAQLPILNQKGMFQIVNATFYLIPQFKGEVTYIIQFKKIPQFQFKSLFLFNCQTLCIQSFNKRMIQRFRLSLTKINSQLQTGAIQFSNLFIFSNDQKDFLLLTQKQTTHNLKANKRIALDSQIHASTQKYNNKDIDRPTSVKALLKMEYLSDIKKSMVRNVTLQAEMAFDISNILYKLIKLEDASTNKQAEAVGNQRTDEINFYKEINKSKQQQFQNSTKDLKKKYASEEFFCPISNPYTPRILQKLNMINSANRVNNLTLIKIIYSVGLICLFGGMVGFKIATEEFSSQILQFEQQAQAINKQYSYFMTGVLRAYELHNMDINKDLFLSYIQDSRGLSEDQAEIFFSSVQTYIKDQKKQMIKKYQDMYFDYPILFDTQPVPIQLFTQFFVLNSTSSTTLIYDMVVVLLDSQTQATKKMIAKNFGIFQTMATILRPDGRYNSKIQSLDNDPGYILLSSALLILLSSFLTYHYLYQLRQARQDIILIYKYIDKKQIFQYIRKVDQIQQLIQILSNNNKINQQSQQQHRNRGVYNTVSQLNSAGNLKSDMMVGEGDGVRVEEEVEVEGKGENEAEGLLAGLEGNKKKGGVVLGKRFAAQSRISILLQTFLNYPIYFLFMLLNCAILSYAYYQAYIQAANYMQAFIYFEKIRAANFQSRYQYVISQSYAYYSSVFAQPYPQPHPQDFISKMTHFQYQKPKQFEFRSEQSLCSAQSVSLIRDLFLAQINCSDVDDSILTQEFSQAYEQYSKDLRTISKLSYQQLLSQPEHQILYSATMYEYFIFGNYLDKLADSNFSQNIDLMSDYVNNILIYIFVGSIAWIVLSFVIVFVVTFPKLETQLATVISLIKMIPPDTLFSMKVAALVKKRNILEKLNRL